MAAPQAAGGALFVLGVLSGLGLAALLGVVRSGAQSGDDEAFFRQVRELVHHSFVQPVDDRAMLDDALRGLVDNLDPYSRYFTGDDLRRLDRETDGEYEGIGVIFRHPLTDGQILFPLSDSPAARAGISVGDRVVAIDEAPVAAMDESAIQTALRRPVDGALTLRVEGLDRTERLVQVEPDHVVDPTVRHVRVLDGERGIGYVYVRSFSRRTPAELDAALDWLRSRDALDGLVLDLRGNPGGVLDAAVAVANRFVAEGVLVTTASRDGTRSETADADHATLAGLPVVVLVDAESASASEVVAGALQDHRAAVVVGERTYGKGTVQKLVPFDEHDAVVKLTTAYYATPAKRIIERELAGSHAGIAPDLEVALPTSERARVIDHLHSYGPPPEVLPALERWERERGESVIARAPDDRQLDAALALLRGEAPLALARAE